MARAQISEKLGRAAITGGVAKCVDRPRPKLFLTSSKYAASLVACSALSYLTPRRFFRGSPETGNRAAPVVFRAPETVAPLHFRSPAVASAVRPETAAPSHRITFEMRGGNLSEVRTATAHAVAPQLQLAASGNVAIGESPCSVVWGRRRRARPRARPSCRRREPRSPPTLRRSASLPPLSKKPAGPSSGCARCSPRRPAICSRPRRSRPAPMRPMRPRSRRRCAPAMRSCCRRRRLMPKFNPSFSKRGPVAPVFNGAA